MEKMKNRTYNLLPISKLTFVLAFCFCLQLNAQEPLLKKYPLSLFEAIKIASENNKTIKAAKIEMNAAEADYKNIKSAMLPRITTAGSYKRFSKVTMFDHGLSDSKSIERGPSANSANLGIDMSFNLYGGGKHRAALEEFNYRKDLAGLNAQNQRGHISLQVAINYIGMVQLYHNKKLIKDQVKRAETRLKNINSLYQNQLVTNSDVLRADLMLSNVLLRETANANDIEIINQQLNVLLDLPALTHIIPVDSISLANPELSVLKEIARDSMANYALQKAEVNVNLQKTRIKSSRADDLPSVALSAAYGLNYPNMNPSPPMDNAYSVGYVGVKVSYNLSSIYKNKNRENAHRHRLHEFTEQKDWLADNINQETDALLIKYNEALNRMQVVEKSIEQARVNYEIINTKYFNQLALLIDLLEADNLYQETQNDLVRARTNAIIIYYKLLYIVGNI